MTREGASTLDELLADPAKVAGLPAEAILPLIAQLAALQSTLAARLAADRASGDNQAEPQAEDRLLTMAQVATVLSVPTGYARELGWRGDLPTVRVGKYVRVRRSDLDEWVVRHREKGLDRELGVALNSPRDRQRGPASSQAARPHPGRIRRTHRRAPRDRQPVGAG